MARSIVKNFLQSLTNIIFWAIIQSQKYLSKENNKMINNFKCADCFFQDKCVAFKKLNAFSAEARTDLGVELDFIDCDKYISMTENSTDYSANDVNEDNAG